MKTRWMVATVAFVAALASAGCGRRIAVKVPITADASEIRSDKGERLLIPEEAPIVSLKGAAAPDRSLYRVAVFTANATRHGTVDPDTFALENAVLWSGRVPVSPAIGILDGRQNLSDIERILRTADANKVDLILQIDDPRLDMEPLVPCAPGKMCLSSTLQVEDMKKMSCTPVGSLPALMVMSVEARIVRVSDGAVVGVARSAMVAPEGKQVRRFDEPSIPNGCRLEIFDKPDPYVDYRRCCRGILDKAKGKKKAQDVCPELLECRDWRPSDAFRKRMNLQGTDGVKECDLRYTIGEVEADERVPQSVGEALWQLQQAAVHSLLGGPSAPAAVPPTHTTLPPMTLDKTDPDHAKVAPTPPPAAPPPAAAPAEADKEKDTGKAKDKGKGKAKGAK